MKSALLVCTTNIENTYTQLEIRKALAKNGYNVRSFNLVSGSVSERAQIQADNPELAFLTDPILPRLNDEYNANVSKLKSLDTLFINDLTAHIEACNKWVSVNRIINSELPFVKTVLTDFTSAPRDDEGKVLYNEVDLDILDEDIERLGGFPLVHKRIYGAIGLHVRLIKSKDHLKEVLTKNETYTGFVLQEYIKSAEAAMLCVRVVGEDVFPRLFLGTPQSEVSFKSVISQGRLQLPCRLTDEIQNLAVSAVRTLNLDTARIDMFITNEGIKICEVNSLGSLLPTDQVHNISVGELIVNHAIKKLKNI